MKLDGGAHTQYTIHNRSFHIIPTYIIIHIYIYAMLEYLSPKNPKDALNLQCCHCARLWQLPSESEVAAQLRSPGLGQMSGPGPRDSQSDPQNVSQLCPNSAARAERRKVRAEHGHGLPSFSLLVRYGNNEISVI